MANYVEATLTYKQVVTVAAPTRVENLTISTSQLAFNGACSGEECSFTNIRIAWDSAANHDREYTVWLAIGGDEHSYLGGFNSHSRTAHSDFPTPCRWLKDQPIVRIYAGRVDAPPAPKGKKTNKTKLTDDELEAAHAAEEEEEDKEEADA